ncbi:DNA repair protein RecO [Marivivens donghaensis]|uniref:DNA repair protein RecO n=1 Tax=Marivivens donghaensis TaxID=1699413 RepID=A0ABX0VUI4_9RHOB|nr:DNA repair protein RecO [Marivivens donghaensis]NIY71723.1 DNA repair protein RecO [Marivivens donghaensis]
MIEWRDEGVLIAARAHGESSMIIEVFTPTQGRHAGVVRGGGSRKMAATLQPGTQISVHWKARLNEHLGSFTVEPVRSRAASVLGDRLALSGLGAVCALLSQSLPEREKHEGLYQRTVRLFDLFGNSDLWPLAYLQWEMALLEELGYGLDLSACAVRGVNEDLAFVSPKSGRAVSAHGAGEWASRLLPLVPVMKGEGDASNAEIAKALGTTGYFIENRVFGDGGRSVPVARNRLIEAIARLD